MALSVNDIKPITGCIGIAPTSPTSSAHCLYFKKRMTHELRGQAYDFLVSYYGRSDFDAFFKIDRFINSKQHLTTHKRITKYWGEKVIRWLCRQENTEESNTVNIDKGYKFTYLPKEL